MNIDKKDNQIEIKYTRASFFQRVMANLVDFIFLMIFFVSSFLLARLIYNSTSEYKTIMNNINEAKIYSGLYMDSSYTSISKLEEYLASEEKTIPQNMKNVKDTISILNDNNVYGAEAQLRGSKAVINCFFKYLKTTVDLDTYNLIIEDRNNYFLKDDFVYLESDGTKIPYFLLEKGEIEQNEECPLKPIDYYKNAYRPYIDNNLQGYLASSVPTYSKSMKSLTQILFFVEIPVSYVLACLLTYFIPPLIFRRGRMTIGKAIYRIGLINSKCLNPSFKTFLLRFIMLFSLELVLSIFTFGLPIIISFSMMAFSKKRQSFIDYILNLDEINVRGSKIFYSLDEIRLSDLSNYHKPIDFKVRNKIW